MVLALFRNRTEPNRPQVVLGLTDPIYAAALSGHLRALDWLVHFADNAADIRNLNVRYRPEVVVLAADRPDETGFLTCAKLHRCRHKPRVLLVSDEMSSGRQAFAAYVGAADFIAAGVGPRSLARRVQALAPVSA